MIRNFIQLWAATQALLVQIATIKGNVKDDVTTINGALTMYKKLLSYGLTDAEIDKIGQAYAMGRINPEVFREFENHKIKKAKS